MSTADLEAQRARSNVLWIGTAILAFITYWLGAQALRTSTISEPRLKVWLTLIALVGAGMQVSTMSRVYGWTPIPHGSIAVIRAVHRWSGRVTIFLGSFVFYLCVTYPFMHGFTWHRLFGFLFAAMLISKLTILRGGVDRLSRLLPYLGATLFGLLVAQFLTRGLHSIW